MLKILVVEGNSPELVDSARAAGQASAAEHFGTTLAALEAGLSFDIAEPYRSSSAPSVDQLSAYAGVVFTGAGVSWSTDAPEAAAQRLFMERVFAAERPSFGSCNGMQLANVVLGGRSAAAPKGLEIGVAADIQLSADGEAHPLHHGRRSGFSCPCIHRDQIAELPTGARATAENAHSIQAMVYEQGGLRFWGVQYHPELGLEQIAHYLQRESGIFSGQAQLLAQVQTAIEDPQHGASALGAEAADLRLLSRTRELQNWLTSLY